MNELDRLKCALNKSHCAVYEWDTANNEIHWSGNITGLLGLDDSQEIASKQAFFDLLHPADRDKFLSSFCISQESGGDYIRNYRITPKENTIISLRDTGTTTIDDDGNARLVGMISTQAPPASLCTSTSHNKNDSTSTSTSSSLPLLPDSLRHTASFREKLIELYDIAGEEKTSHTLLHISIDNIPMMITWYSAEFAERIMQALECHLMDLLSSNDIVGRMGTDQFGIILHHTKDNDVEPIINGILQRIQRYHNPSFEEPIHLRTSIGSVTFPSGTDNADDAQNKAYLALTSAKNSSESFHYDYEDAKKEHLASREQVGQLYVMKKAFAEDRFCMAYQPIVRSSNGSTESYECLLRIRHGDEIMSAGGLIMNAEKMGAIDIVDHFTLERIIEELQQNPNIRLGFNVSNMTTDNPKWLKMCTRLLHDPSIAQRLVVEITETAAHRDLRQTAYFVATLQALGCKVALDDFGAGYTSFRQLKSLSLDIIKIDGRYVLNLEENSENLVFIKTLLQFAKSYGLETIAECVENGETAKILMNAGVTYMQGYYFGKPDINRPWNTESIQKVAG